MMAAATAERPLDGALPARVWFIAGAPVFWIVLQNLSLRNAICAHDFRLKTRFIFGCNRICTLSKHLAGASAVKISCVSWQRSRIGIWRYWYKIGGLGQKYWFVDWRLLLFPPAFADWLFTIKLYSQQGKMRCPPGENPYGKGIPVTYSALLQFIPTKESISLEKMQVEKWESEESL